MTPLDVTTIALGGRTLDRSTAVRPTEEAQVLQSKLQQMGFDSTIYATHCLVTPHAGERWRGPLPVAEARAFPPPPAPPPPKKGLFASLRRAFWNDVPTLKAHQSACASTTLRGDEPLRVASQNDLEAGEQAGKTAAQSAFSANQRNVAG